ncbi:hypothetical protein ENH_00064200 [Eimeria necatrix]|uniref:Uncharacterized protein n=1 Tax=Eimeria necatrix TaxID=51315 RepID=U6N360_9EIME|nr:hypothetical protein ENH_00064200 [Eimeria necatrix]CDJ69169.1 hypothetical protein ENH_00064200 [Eimeria necatrix]
MPHGALWGPPGKGKGPPRAPGGPPSDLGAPKKRQALRGPPKMGTGLWGALWMRKAQPAEGPHPSSSSSSSSSSSELPLLQQGRMHCCAAAKEGIRDWGAPWGPLRPGGLGTLGTEVAVGGPPAAAAGGPLLQCLGAPGGIGGPPVTQRALQQQQQQQQQQLGLF